MYKIPKKQKKIQTKPKNIVNKCCQPENEGSKS